MTITVKVLFTGKEDFPEFSVEDFDQELAWFLDGRTDLSYDRKRVGRAVTYTIYKDGEELSLIRIAPSKVQLGGLEISTRSTARRNAQARGPWLMLGSFSDPEGVVDEKDRKFRAIYEDFLWHFRMTHRLDKGGRRLEGFEFMDQGGTSGDGVDKRPLGRPREPENDWAYQKIKAGWDQTKVYEEWFEKIPESRRLELADPLDSFKSAMRYRRKREKKD